MLRAAAEIIYCAGGECVVDCLRGGIMRIAIVRNGKELAERAFVEIRKVLAEKPERHEL